MFNDCESNFTDFLKKKELGSRQPLYRFTQTSLYVLNFNNLAPDYLASQFKFKHYEHYTTQAMLGKLLDIPQTRTEIFKKSLSFSGCNLQNTLPFSRRHSKSLAHFKNPCQRFLRDSLYLLELLRDQELCFVFSATSTVQCSTFSSFNLSLCFTQHLMEDWPVYCAKWAHWIKTCFEW